MLINGIPTTGIDPTFDYLVFLFGPSTRRRSYSPTFDYPDFEAMRADFERRGTITINTQHSEHTIFSTPEHNYMFRYWHDICHIKANADFSAIGEARAAALQMQQVRALVGPSDADKDRWCAIIDAEVNGQTSYYLTHGTFPVNQRAFVLDYLRRAGWTPESFPRNLNGLVIEY